MWSDNETTEDLLGFQVHADLIRSIVTDENMLPTTVGIFGDWGSGKTSVMKMLEKSLNPNDYAQDSIECEKIACLYFNGWLFEGYDDAKSAIIGSILLQLYEHKRFGPRIKKKVVSLLKSVDVMRLARFGLKSGILPGLAAYLLGGDGTSISIAGASALVGEGKVSDDSDLETDTEESNNDLQKLIKTNAIPSAHLDVRSFRDQFSELISECKIDALVVLIDDLDRCSPERIVDNLEAIKLFLNVDQTAFVIGADPRIVRHAILTQYKSVEIQEKENQVESEHGLVNDYLEKLIQIPYHLPRLSPTEVETYMVLLFCLRDLETKDAEKCLEAFYLFREKNRYSVFGYSNVKNALEDREISEPLSKSLTFCATSAPLITEGLKGNPRQVKRFLNAFTLRKQLAEVANLEHIRDEVLVKLMVLEYTHQEQYRKLYEWQTAAEGYPEEIKELEANIFTSDNNDNENSSSLSSDEDIDVDENDMKKVEKTTESSYPDWETSFMQRWIAMDPPLSQVDLRDYFWISRDRLQSTFSGISMVSPIVRRIIENLISGNKGKSKTAAQEVIDWSEDERTSLLTQLEKHVSRHPTQEEGYDALQALIEVDIYGAAGTLARVINICPAKSIPAHVSFILLSLVKGKPELKEILQPVIDQLRKTQSQIGRSLQKQNPNK